MQRMRSRGLGRFFGGVLMPLLGVVAACCGGSHLATPTSNTTLAAGTARATSFPGAGCPLGAYSALSSQEMKQSMDGAISGCFRVAALSPGHYSVVVEAVQSPKAAASEKSLSAPRSTDVGPSVQLKLSPAEGGPGSLVEVTGLLSSPPSKKVGSVQLCWDGCERGLNYEGVPIKWVSPTEFSASMIIPAAPWFMGGGDRVAALASGDYRVSVECLTMTSGCGLAGSEGSGTFHLDAGSKITTWCVDTAGCARLTASPTAVLPGDVVKVTGYAPLQSIIGSSQPYQFELKIMPGVPPSEEVSYSRSPMGSTIILMGHGRFTVGIPPSLASLGKITPGAPASDGGLSISQNPANPGLVVWCSQGRIEVSGPNESQGISTEAAARELALLGYGLMGASAPRCSSVVLADGGSVGKIVLASFLVAPKSGAPPFVSVALQTFDGGATWKLVPAPFGAQTSGFAGFRYYGSSVEALFAPMPSKTSGTYDATGTPLVETLKSGQSNWVAGRLGCALRGPCVTFGSYIPGNCAMNGSTQSILYSNDQGVTWLRPSWPVQAQACWPGELVPISLRKELLISTGSQYFVRESVDGGASWRVIGIPPIPGATPGSGFSGSSAELQMLTNGSLLVTGQRGSRYQWYLLVPGSHNWCSPKGLPVGLQRSARFAPVRQVGDALYWIPPTNGSAAVLRSVPVASVKC